MLAVFQKLDHTGWQNNYWYDKSSLFFWKICLYLQLIKFCIKCLITFFNSYQPTPIEIWKLFLNPSKKNPQNSSVQSRFVDRPSFSVSIVNWIFRLSIKNSKRVAEKYYEEIAIANNLQAQKLIKFQFSTDCEILYSLIIILIMLIK